jgi:alkaline phosphatase D
MGLEDYRYLHRTYRSDAFLREALSAHTLVQTWDDHEIVNNRYWNYSEERPYAGEGDHPKNDDGEFMTQLFADGIRAWWEYTPTRVPYDPDAESLLDQLELWRSFQFGDLVELLVTDERLYRTSPTDGSQLGARPDDEREDDDREDDDGGDGDDGDDGEGEDDDGDDLAETMLWPIRRRRGPPGSTRCSRWSSTSTWGPSTS